MNNTKYLLFLCDLLYKEKATPWEGGIRTVAFVWSKLLPQRKLLPSQLMHISDWLPTLYQAAGNITSVI